MNTMIRKINPKTFAASLWLLTTLSLAGWWMSFSLKLIGQSHLPLEYVFAQRRMLYWEGSAWLVLLLVGGGFLIYYSQRENRRFNDFVKFVSAYNHDAKTTLMNIMLQTERLTDSNDMLLCTENQKTALKRLTRSVLRLRTQIENSLYLSNHKDVFLHIEKIILNDFVKNLALDYPQINLSIEISANQFKNNKLTIEADKKGLESIFRNLIENAIEHGKAKSLKINVMPIAKSNFLVSISDDGNGFKGDQSQLGQPFQSQRKSSGSGLGLYLVKYLAEKMNGSSAFKVINGKLVIELSLKGQLV